MKALKISLGLFFSLTASITVAYFRTFDYDFARYLLAGLVYFASSLGMVKFLQKYAITPVNISIFSIQIVLPFFLAGVMLFHVTIDSLFSLSLITLGTLAAVVGKKNIKFRLLILMIPFSLLWSIFNKSIQINDRTVSHNIIAPWKGKLFYDTMSIESTSINKPYIIISSSSYCRQCELLKIKMHGEKNPFLNDSIKIYYLYSDSISASRYTDYRSPDNYFYEGYAIDSLPITYRHSGFPQLTYVDAEGIVRFSLGGYRQDEELIYWPYVKSLIKSVE